MKKLDREYKRGDYIEVVLEEKALGSEQAGIRPAIVIQNNMGNKYSPTLIVVFLTTSETKAKLPTHVKTTETRKESTILAEQIRTISKKRIRRYFGQASEEVMKEVDKCLKISLGLN